MFDNTSLYFLYISTLEIFVHNDTILYCNCLTVNIVNKEAALNLVLCDLLYHDQQPGRRTEIPKV